MDLSDDVGYSVHDVEDAIALGRMDPALLLLRSEERFVESPCSISISASKGGNAPSDRP